MMAATGDSEVMETNGLHIRDQRVQYTYLTERWSRLEVRNAPRRS
jgi:hypothetical protein